VALGLRLHALGRFSLGNDEIEEARWSRRPAAEMLRLVAGDAVHPPLDYVVQLGIERTGAPEWARRLPSVAAGTATVLLAALLARRWFGAAAGLGAALLLACSPIHVRYSQEVRPYAAGIFFLFLAVWALDACRSRPSRRTTLVWFFAVLAAAWTLYLAGLVAVLVSATLIALGRRGGLATLWRRAPLILVAWAALYAPWLPHALSAARRPPPVAGETLDGEWLRYRLQVLGTGDYLSEPVSAGSWAFWGLVVVGLVAAARAVPGVAAAVWLAGGAAAQLALMRIRPHYPAVRHLLPVWSGAILLAGAGVGSLVSVRRARWLAPVALAGVLAFDARSLAAYYDHGRPEWGRVADLVARGVGPGETVVVSNTWVLRNLGYYWNERGLGKPGVSLDSPEEVEGPAWLVIAICPMGADLRREIDALPLRLRSPNTNGLEVRFVPPGTRLRWRGRMCLREA